ncbi:hypothetical protein PR202_ga24361 [Eleusine coracana subsp. coracana]|uniref:Reverse transcriptase zinc-binding domain-containing protein n=1 Tax=Eleusine coracana subsp. coracana TaxID=191504 RepID=A0AAV5D6P9_ELECO|nr:hypothetical protein PR202_ga24361 [Eleusine coracana subsp. coracana]
MARYFWFRVLAPIDLLDSVPRRSEKSFAEWWRKTIKKAPKERRKGINIVIILAAWVLWKHRNSCIFDNTRPSIVELTQSFKEEHHLWCLAGAKGLRALLPGQGDRLD